MDSQVQPRPARLAEPPDAPLDLDRAEAESPGALARIGRLLPGVDGVVRFAYGTAAASAVSAGLVVVAVAQAGADRGLLAALGLLLLTPALAAALAGWTLADLASLPAQVRDAARAAAGRQRGGAAPKESRIGRLLRSLWAARGLALLTRGGVARAVGAVRFVRLASLPFLLGLVGFVALNALVIAGGVVALLVLVL